jgi:hypothetical protein
MALQIEHAYEILDRQSRETTGKFAHPPDPSADISAGHDSDAADVQNSAGA